MDKSVTFLHLNICYAIYVLLGIKYWLMWFESLLVLKKRPNISGIQIVKQYYFFCNILKQTNLFGECVSLHTHLHNIQSESEVD